ncbi:MAG: glycosyltransferase family 4 protein [Cyanobacteriota bacterium]|nr:glycosyltransferase family 4 protein [Cyanobacteriota bacterium]
MKHHLLLYTDDLGIGGVAQFNHSLLCRLAELGYRLSHVCAVRDPQLQQQEIARGIEQIELDYHAGKDLTRTLKDLEGAKKIFSQTQPDTIVFSDGWPFSNFAAKQAAIDLGIPYAIVLGFIEPSCIRFTWHDESFYVELTRYYYARAQMTIAVSNENLRLLRHLFQLPADLGQTIYNGRPAVYFQPPCWANRRRLRQEFEIPEDAIVCFTAARMETLKGYQYQIEAMKCLKPLSIWSRIYFVWAGTGSESRYSNESKLKAAIARLGVAEHVKCIGQRRDIPDWLDASDIFVLPSLAEGMPLCVMEAMAKGLPTIASAVSGIPEQLGQTGKLLPDPKLDPTGTIRELVETIVKWGESPQLRQLIGLGCKRRAESLFKEERMLQEYAEAIDGMFSARNSTKGRSHRALTQSPQTHRELERHFRYSSLVWQGCYAYYREDPEKMVEYLLESLNYTPFLKVDTISSWLKSAISFFQEKGEPLNVYRLSELPQWQDLMGRTLGYRPVRSSRVRS